MTLQSSSTWEQASGPATSAHPTTKKHGAPNKGTSLYKSSIKASIGNGPPQATPKPPHPPARLTQHSPAEIAGARPAPRPMVVAPEIHGPGRTAARPAEPLGPLFEEARLLPAAVDLEPAFHLGRILDQEIFRAYAAACIVSGSPSRTTFCLPAKADGREVC